MRVLVLPRYTRLGASSRARFFQYLPYLESVGIQTEVSPFFRDRYQEIFQRNGRRSVTESFLGYMRRTAALLKSKQFDLVWIEKDALPWLPVEIEGSLLPAKTPYVLDYDDAVFHYYDLHRSAAARRLVAHKHDWIMRGAAVVVAGNAYIAEHARRAGASSVEIIPTVVDMEQYSAALIEQGEASSDPVVVGWIGQPHNAHYLNLLGDVIKRLAREGNTRFVAVGARKDSADLPFEPVAWSEASEVEQIANFEIGIMPLPDEPFERGKCGYKLIQYMACGKPVIASPVGVNREIVEHGVNGFLAETPSEWEEALRALTRSRDLRTRMGAAGRRRVERTYSLQVTAPRVAELLTRTATGTAVNH